MHKLMINRRLCIIHQAQLVGQFTIHFDFDFLNELLIFQTFCDNQLGQFILYYPIQYFFQKFERK